MAIKASANAEVSLARVWRSCSTSAVTPPTGKDVKPDFFAIRFWRVVIMLGSRA